MEIVEKKFQTIQVSAGLMSTDYHKKLEREGYELLKVEMGSDQKIKSYTFKLRQSTATHK